MSLRLRLTRFEIERIELESRDAAKEALFCVREDGMSMEEVATEGVSVSTRGVSSGRRSRRCAAEILERFARGSAGTDATWRWI